LEIAAPGVESMNSDIEASAASHDAHPIMLLPAVTGFYFAFRVFFVVLAVHVLHADPQVGVAFSLVLNFLLLGVVVFDSLGPAPRTVGQILRLPCFFWVLFFLGFSGCSLIWSVAVSLPAAAAFWGAMAADVAIVVLLLRTGPIVEVSSSLMKGFVYGTCCIALIAWIMPAQSDLRLGDDEVIGPNAIGYACAFAIFLAEYLIQVRHEQKRWRLPVLLLALTLLRSLSKTSIIAFAIGQTLILFRNKSIPRKTKTMLIVGLLLTIVVFWGLLASYYDAYTGAAYQAETLTGRIGIWLYILNEAVQSPWIGHGFHSVWKVIPPFGVDQFEARHAHNELLQQFYTYGAVGVLMLTGLYLSFYRRARKLREPSLRVLLLGLLVFGIIRGLTDTDTFDLTLPLWSIAMFSAIMAEADLSHSAQSNPSPASPPFLPLPSQDASVG
jgi:exopolysaccharide production protein ExoQ